MSETQENTESARDRVLVFLSFFTSPESQRAFAPAIPEEKLAYALCDIWFDRVFVPGTRYMEGIKGDWNAEASATFRASFDDEEWKFIERFNRFLELRIDMMSDTGMSDKKIPNNNLWESILRDARYLFELLEPDAKKRQFISESIPRGLLDGSGRFLKLNR